MIIADEQSKVNSMDGANAVYIVRQHWTGSIISIWRQLNSCISVSVLFVIV